ITHEEWQGIEGGIARIYGHCITMGTASTITAIAEAMGLTLPGASSIPAADANHQLMSAACGRRIVDIVWVIVPARRSSQYLKPSVPETSVLP
ncbi:dihydroxy-acid dehydratase, partial [Rhizobium ruizarguesonis]